MSAEFYERMKQDIDRARAIERNRVPPPSLIVAREYTPEQFADWVRGVQAEPPLTDATWGLSVFIVERQDSCIPTDIRAAAADAAAAHITAHSDDPDISVVRLFLAWGAHQSDYRRRAVELLRHPQPMVRREALHLAYRFLLPADFPQLLTFQRDPFAAEIGMGGPLRFWLRDDALTLLEAAFERPVADYDQVESTAEGRAYYRSWRPFLDWYATYTCKSRYT